jgi:hypothetical protein
LLVTQPGYALPPTLTNHLPGAAISLGAQTRSTASSEQHLAPALIIKDLIAALGFALPPLRTTIQINVGSSDVVGQNFVVAMAKAGYGIQWVIGDEGSHFFSYSIREKSTSGHTGNSEQFRVSIGSIAVERSYALSTNGEVIPDSALILRGSRANVALNDVHFATAQPLSIDVSQVSYMDAVPMDDSAPELTLLADDLAR